MVREDLGIAPRSNILVDGHVHIYDGFDLRTLFESAQKNFCSVAGKIGFAGQFSSILLLTESQGTNYFSTLLQTSQNKSYVDGWKFQATLESESLVAISPTGFELTIIAGRQIVTAEKLEVLAVCTGGFFADGGQITEIIAAISAANGVPIVPWGFGKWTGQRKRVISHLMGEFTERPFHLGDNSGRISLRPEPSQFERARLQRQRVFRGTDPLPFPGQEKRVGSFGFYMNGPFNRSEPAASMRNLLCSTNIEPMSYGSLESPAIFVKHQLKMQAQKWHARMRQID